MHSTTIFEKLTPLLCSVFDRDDLIATPNLSAKDVDGWDSLANVRLFIEIENAFSIRFSATEIATLRNVGQLAEMIERKNHSSAS